MEPKRYKKIDIDKNVLNDFFNECGDYEIKNLDKQASPIWTKCYENHDYNVFESLEKKNIKELKNLYENYYVNGLSDGATSGKALENKDTRDSKSKRNLMRQNKVDYLMNKDG